MDMNISGPTTITLGSQGIRISSSAGLTININGPITLTPGLSQDIFSALQGSGTFDPISGLSLPARKAWGNMICMKPYPILDDVHVVFGQVIQGLDVMKNIEGKIETRNGKPSKPVVVAHCAEL
ncbi:hypothetical protein EUTSA_v10012122mg [Eutrema salsugineum]|uniref:PPIase cyclophilin-type domain-containing protein n=1 Tax=Eutrema salsugineum TaxID=72664 RepID=V4KKI1_EUTSA|nr:hypothetical protein EUTSA_v10012122mg [Eutrema salsugineum]